MTDMATFDFEQHKLRTVFINGEPWFVAKDVCAVLEHSNHKMAVKGLDADERGVSKVYTHGGVQEATVISESGLYSLTVRSNKPQAREFKRWITHEVLPTIRKTGGVYLSPEKAEELINNPDLIIGLAQQVKDLRVQNEQKQRQIEADLPKVLFADSVSASETSILIGQMAKLLKQNGYDTGAKRFAEWLRQNGYLIARVATDKNMPSQYSMERGLMRVHERTVNVAGRGVIISRTTLITGKGQRYFMEKLVNGKKYVRVGAVACG